jgi:hypothetical protein
MNKEVYDRYGLLNLPRNFGFPMQMSLHSVKQLERIIDANDGKVPLYISHNSHNNEYVNVAQIYFDFDGHGTFTMEEALRDERKIAEYLESQKVDFLADMTGRGFRILLKVDPDIVRIRDIDGVYKGYSKYIKQSLNLKTMDLKVAEPKRIMRIPLTTYIYKEKTGENITTKRHVLPLDMDMLFNSDLQELIYKSETLEFGIMPLVSRRMSLKELYEYKQESQYIKNDILDEDIDFMEFSEDYFIEQIYDIIRDTDEFGHDKGPDISLIKKLLSVHPDNNARFIGCIKVKESNYHLNFNSNVSFFAKLSQIAKWDNRNLDKQREIIRGIYQSGYGVKKK